VNHNRSSYGYFLVLSIIAIGFFSAVFLNQRNYQDVWILQGIVVPTAIFIFFFLVAETFIQENKTLVILAASLLAAMNLVPGLKYQLFSGVFDAPSHFRFTDQIASQGYIPENEHISEQYSGNPGMHIFMASISIISGISTNDVFRFIIPALSGLVPFIIYFVTKDILDNTTQRYVIIASSFPIFTKMNKRTFLLIFAILGFNVIISHAITSLFVSFLLVGTLIILKSLEILGKKSLGRVRVATVVAPSLLYVVLFLAWWANTSSYNLNTLVDLTRALLVGAPTSTPVPTRFHSISLMPRLQVLAVFHLRDGIIGMLSLFGLFVFLRKLRLNEVSDKTETFYKFLIVFLSNFALFLFFEFVSGFGNIEYGRFIVYALPLCVFLVGLTLWRLCKFLNGISVKPIIRNLAFASFLFILVSSCLIQFYRCQLLVPRSNVLSDDLPENEYLVYFGVVNTIYQIEMISFAEMHSYNSSIASDATTRFQVYGFSDPSFFSRHVWHSPLKPGQSPKWGLFLLHTVKAGHPSEKAEYRTRERIENFRLEAGNIIYDNGESFIISFSPHNHNPNQD